MRDMDYKDNKRFKELVRLYGINHAEIVWKKRLKMEEERKIGEEKQRLKRESKALKKAKIRSLLEDFQKTKPNKIKHVKSKKSKSKKPKKLKQLTNPYKKKTKFIPLDILAQKLENNLPKSEQWFRSLYETQELKHELDEYNSVFGRKYIGDIVNRKYKYIIEIDGSIHDTAQQIFKDKKKDALCKALGYKVFRIKHNSIVDYINIIKLILKIRGEQSDLFLAFCSRFKAEK